MSYQTICSESIVTLHNYQGNRWHRDQDFRDNEQDVRRPSPSDAQCKHCKTERVDDVYKGGYADHHFPQMLLKGDP